MRAYLCPLYRSLATLQVCCSRSKIIIYIYILCASTSLIRDALGGTLCQHSFTTGSNIVKYTLSSNRIIICCEILTFDALSEENKFQYDNYRHVIIVFHDETFHFLIGVCLISQKYFLNVSSLIEKKKNLKLISFLILPF